MFTKTIRFVLAAIILSACPAFTQELGHYLQGAAGLDGGGVPPPGVYFTYLSYVFPVSSFQGPNGNTLAKLNLTTNIPNAVVTAVVKTKFLGADYGYSFVAPYANKRLTTNLLPVGDFQGGGFSDWFFEPLILGWHKPHADILFSYGFYQQTGDYSPDTPLKNTGLGFSENQFQLGSNIFLSKSKAITLSVLSTWEINQTRTSEDVKPGPMLTLEYGIGKKFLKGALNLGASGYYYRKLAADSGSEIPDFKRGIHDQALGLGPEVQLTLPIKMPLFVQFVFRYQPQFDVEARPQGQVFVTSLTLFRLFLPHQ